MSSVFTYLKREYFAKVMTRGFFIGTLFGPIIIAGLYGLPVLLSSVDESSTRIIQYVDYSDSMGAMLPLVFGDTLDNGAPRFVLSEVQPEVYEADTARFYASIREEALDGLLLISKDVLGAGQATFYTHSASDLSFNRDIRARVQSAVSQVRLQKEGLDPQLIVGINAPVDLKVVSTDEDESEAGSPETAVPIALVFTMILYVTTITYGTMVMRGVIEEKSSRIMEILLSTSSPFELMLGKLFGIGSAGLTQYLAWVILVFLAINLGGYGINNTFSVEYVSSEVLVYFVLFFLLAFFQFAALYAAVGAMCSAPEDAQSASMPIVFLIVIPFVVSLSSGLSNPDSSLSQLLSLLPFFAPMVMFVRVIMGNPSIMEILFAFATNIATILLITWAAARIYRVGVLMYGKRISFGEAMRWVRVKD